MNLSTPITEFKGVGEALAKKLQKLGINTAEDLLYHYPRRYDDFSKIMPITKIRPGPVTIKGEITRAATRRSGRGRSITEALITDETGTVKAVWFNQPYLASSLPKNVPVYVSGTLEFKYSSYALQSPVVERVSEFTKNTARIVPVYPETEGITSKQLRGLVQQLLPVAVEDILPKAIIKEFKLLTKSEALEQIHFPKNTELMEAARYRLAFEEVYILVMTSRALKAEVQGLPALRVSFDPAVAKEFVGKLPFKLTNAQRLAAWEILKDIERDIPMNRLLQGDVGSGKTVVAAFAALMAAQVGFQTAFMAPTEVLARQHLKTLSNLLVPFKAKSGLLVSSLKKSEKAAVLDDLKAGRIQIIIGTHALLVDPVQFHKLGLVVIDEQHRFGVEQRNLLRSKTKLSPHFLSMSATPIPRSLALTVYGDLDISTINELPPGRKPVITRVVTEKDATYQHIGDHITSGKQVYVICPLIAESDKLGAASVEQEVKKLRKNFPKAQVEGLHGRLKPAEKETIMKDFHEGRIDMLVSTTVVEVGVDVANASIMLIEGAERFGLATLHQLRGRVGRGADQSYCYLATSERGMARHRLELMETHNDGFILAVKDLDLRGAGELYGQRQHGELDLKIAKLNDIQLIKTAQKAAEMTGNPVQYPMLQKTINKLKKLKSLN